MRELVSKHPIAVAVLGLVVVALLVWLGGDGDTSAPPSPSTESLAASPPPPTAQEDQEAVMPDSAECFHVAGRVPMESEVLTDQIAVFFDAPIAVPDQPDSPLIALTPERPGEIRVGPNSIGYFFAEPGAAGSSIYRVSLSPGLRSTDGRPLAESDREFVVADFTFKPESIVLEDENADTTTVAIAFTAAVRVEDVQRFLRCEDAGGRGVVTAVREGTNPETVRATVAGEVCWPVAFLFAEDLPEALGLLHLARPYRLHYPESPFFRVVAQEWAKRGAIESSLAVRFNVKVAAADFASHAEVFTSRGQAVPFRMADAGRRSEELELLVDTTAVAGEDVAIVIDGTLPGAGRRVLGKTARFGVKWEASALAVLSASLEGEGDHEQQVVLEFNAAVDADELKRFLSLSPEREDFAFSAEVTSSGLSTRHQVTVVSDDPYLGVGVRIENGLAGEDAAVLKEPYEAQVRRVLEAAAPPGLRVEDTYWDCWRARWDKNGAQLHVRFNEPVTVASLKEHLEIDPPIGNVHIEPGWSNGVGIKGEWMSKQLYTLRIRSGLEYRPSDDKTAVLDQDLEFRTTSEEIPPYIGIGYDGKCYFPRRSGGTLTVESRNLDRATISLARMFPSNVAAALDDLEDDRVGLMSAKWSEAISTTEITIARRPDRIVETPLRVDECFPPDKKGVFVLDVSAEDGPEVSKLVLLTDLGVLAHWRDEELAVFAHELTSLAPKSLAKVTVYSTKNQLLGAANTDRDGIARLGPFDTSLGIPRVAVVESGDDYTFLELDAREGDEEGVSGSMPSYNRDGYEAFVYADRDLYRPGETVHARWIVRTGARALVADVPLTLKVVKPNGRVLFEGIRVLSSLGTGAWDITTEKAYPTGLYTIQLSVPGSESSIGSYAFHLEEFVPNRIKVDLGIAEMHWLAANDYSFRLSAQHLFGAPAKDRRCEASVTVQQGGIASDSWKSYRFGNDTAFTPASLECGEAVTDAEGNAQFSFNYAAPAEVTFPLAAVVIGRVFELGGRAVISRQEVPLFPSDVCLGVRMQREASGEIRAHVAAVKPDGSPAGLASVRVTLEKQAWNYYVRRYYSHHEPHWSESFEELETKEVALVAGVGETAFTVDGYGYYRVRVHSDATRQYSTQSFYLYGSWFETVEEARPSLIKIALDKEEYAVGDVAHVRIESPFDGQGVVVVQGAEIQQVRPVAIKDNVGLVDLHVAEAQCPNVWVEVTVIHRVETSEATLHPASSFAMANLKVIDPAKRVDVAMPDVPAEIRPATKAAFVVETRTNAGAPVSAELTLAAVDEGIHAITDYADPDPYGWLFRPRQPDVRRAHYYDKIAYDFAAPAIGGDALGLGRRASSVGENWIRPVALWSGVAQTDASGRATIEMDVPEFTGQLRLVAVACTADGVGASSAHVFVRRTYLLRTSMPRFLLPGDAAVCNAVVFNNSDTPCIATVDWQAVGALSPGDGREKVAVPAHGEASVRVEVQAQQRIGQGRIDWSVVVGDEQGAELERLAEQANIPVRPPAVYQSHNDLRALPPGESVVVKNEVFVDDDQVSMQVVVGANPLIQVRDALDYVVGYPYGCVEQTTSQLMPMLILHQLGVLSDVRPGSQDEVRANIQAGIDRLFTMQTYAGGLAYWPGLRDPYPYGSVYALHFLALAKNTRAFDVQEENYAALQRYVSGLVEDWTDASMSSRFQRAYALYTLALDGNLEAIEQIGRFDTVAVPRAARLLLAAALAHSTQDMDRVRQYLAARPAEVFDQREMGGTLNSSIKNTAIELLVAPHIGVEPSAQAELAEQLLRWVAAERHGTTHETAFVVTALAGYLNGLAAGIENAAAAIEGAELAASIVGGELFSKAVEGPGAWFRVNNTGQVPMYVSVTTRGVPAQPVTEATSQGGLRVERRFYTADGRRFEEAAFPHSAAYVVEIAIEAESPLENVVVCDLFGGGFEVENPRLNPESLPAGRFGDALRPTYLDVRDDRVVFAFDTLPQGLSRLYYVVRAVTPGRFTYPATEAECMYDGSVQATSDLRVVEIRP
ncbi:MAG TPA: MG2 domain-containing protein [Candidatus Hydrogenedentes bacterium]|nr:MG2 domain-containing protein [Candidatus Hydrogenedentota bacterium]